MLAALKLPAHKDVIACGVDASQFRNLAKHITKA